MSGSSNNLTGRPQQISFLILLTNWPFNYASRNLIRIYSPTPPSFCTESQLRLFSYLLIYACVGMQQVLSWRGRVHRLSTRSTKQDGVVVAEKIAGNTSHLATKSKTICRQLTTTTVTITITAVINPFIL